MKKLATADGDSDEHVGIYASPDNWHTWLYFFQFQESRLYRLLYQTELMRILFSFDSTVSLSNVHRSLFCNTTFILRKYTSLDHVH